MAALSVEAAAVVALGSGWSVVLGVQVTQGSSCGDVAVMEAVLSTAASLTASSKGIAVLGANFIAPDPGLRAGVT